VQPHTAPEKLAPAFDVPVRPPRTGENPGTERRSVTEDVVLDVKIGFVTRARGGDSGEVSSVGISVPLMHLWAIVDLTPQSSRFSDVC